MNGELILRYPGERDDARAAFLDGEAMLSGVHNVKIDRRGANKLKPALVLIQCAGNTIVTIPWPPQPVVKRRSGCLAALGVVALLVALFGLLLIVS